MIKSKLIIGTAQFGIKSYGINNINGSQSIKQVREILNLSLKKKNNISILDTAPSYGDAEMKIGKCYNNNPLNASLKFQPIKLKI